MACLHKVRASVEVKTKFGGTSPVRGTVQTGFLTHLMHEHSCPAAFSQQQARAIHSHKTPISHHFGLETAQKRFRNGYMSGRETLERAVSAPPRCNEQPWEVSFASGKTSRRVSRARVVMLPWSFRPESLRGPIVAYVAACRNASETVE